MGAMVADHVFDHLLVIDVGDGIRREKVAEQRFKWGTQWVLQPYRSRCDDEVLGLWEVFLSGTLAVELVFPAERDHSLEGVALFLSLEVWDLDRQVMHGVGVPEAADPGRLGQIEDAEPQVDATIDERDAKQFWWLSLNKRAVTWCLQSDR